MAIIIIPFPFGDLPIKPELTGKIKVTDDITQTLATVMGWDGSARRLVRTALSGCLQTTSPQVRGIIHNPSSGPNEVITFGSVPTTEVMIMGHPSNGELIWVSIGPTPTTGNSWPLAATDSLIVSIDNLAKLKILIVTTANVAIVLYTR